MKTDREFIDCVYNKIAERNNSGYTALKHRSISGKIGTAAAALFIVCMVIILPEFLNPVLKNSALSEDTDSITAAGTAGTAETGGDLFGLDGIGTDRLCEIYDLVYKEFYPETYIQTTTLNDGLTAALSGTGLKIACPSEWTYGDKDTGAININQLLYKLLPDMQASLSGGKADTVRIITDYLNMLYGEKPDILREDMTNGTVYYCIKYPDSPPTGELSDAELKAFYDHVTAYFYFESDSGYLMKFLLNSTKENIEFDTMRYLAMFSTVEIYPAPYFIVNLPLDSYTPTMSSVPGLPVTLSYSKSGKVKYNIIASDGVLLTNDNCGKVKNYIDGGEYTEAIILYWSPLDDHENRIPGTGNDKKGAVISITAYTEDGMICKCNITIKNNNSIYSAFYGEITYTNILNLI